MRLKLRNVKTKIKIAFVSKAMRIDCVTWIWAVQVVFKNIKISKNRVKL